LLSTENTAIDRSILRYLKEEFVQGAIPFKLKAKVYNTFHGYTQDNSDESSGEELDYNLSQSKKKKR
jgi:hypothetical protein